MLQNTLIPKTKVELPITELKKIAKGDFHFKSNIKSNNFGHASIVKKFINQRMHKLSDENQNIEKMDKVSHFWNFLLDYYFRVEMSGWERLPNTASMLVGIHSGTWLTIDAWTLCGKWLRKFNNTRILHGTAHDVLMSLPVLGNFFRKAGVIPATRKSIDDAFKMGHDVVIWPGGELDAMRSWSKRGKVVLGGRTGFIRQAIRSGVPIVPVATIGGTETVFVLSECRKLAKVLNLKKHLRCEIAPLVFGLPFGVTLEAFPMHIPMPAKIRTKILDPIEIVNDPDKENDNDYVAKKYKEIENSIQQGVNQLTASRRRLPVFC